MADRDKDVELKQLTCDRQTKEIRAAGPTLA
jgi:hypothetical protein